LIKLNIKPGKYTALKLHIFIDEAGDLGFSRGSSRFFVVAYFMPDNPWGIRSALKRYHRHVNENKREKYNELHFSDADEKIRIECYRRMRKHPWKTGLIILDKSTVSRPLIGKTDILYNYSILHFMFWSILRNYNPTYDLNIKIDRGMSRRRREHFNQYGASKADFIWRKMNKQGNSIRNKINIEHDHSQNDYCLQFADFLSSGTFQLYEKGRYQYFSEYKDKISKISYLFRRR